MVENLALGHGNWAVVRFLQRPTNRRAGKAESGSILKLHRHRQSVAVTAASPGGCLQAVALIDHADDVVAGQRAKIVHLLKRLDGRQNVPRQSLRSLRFRSWSPSALSTWG